MLDCMVLLEGVLGRRLRVVRVPLAPLRWIGRMVRPFNQALDAVLEIAEFVEREGLLPIGFSLRLPHYVHAVWQLSPRAA